MCSFISAKSPPPLLLCCSAALRENSPASEAQADGGLTQRRGGAEVFFEPRLRSLRGVVSRRAAKQQRALDLKLG